MKFLARGISIVFHPLLITMYVLILCMLINPYLFGVQDSKSIGVIIISVFLLSFFFPIISILMMKALGLISSLEMKDKRERIGPMIATAIFYLWLYINIKDNSVIPGAFSFFVLGATIAMFLAFFLNTFQKISLHGVGVGGFLVVVMILGYQFSYGSFIVDVPMLGTYHIDVFLLYIIAIFITGITLTARLILGAHNKEELYGGLFIGAASQLFGYAIFF